MKRRLLLLTLPGLLGPLLACSDAGVAPIEPVALVIESGAVVVREVTLRSGERIRLSALARRADGSHFGAEASWHALDPGIAAVDEEGWLVAGETGDTRVIAFSRALSDTLVVTVLDGNAGAGDCSAPQGAIALAVGGSYTTSGLAASHLCLSGGAEYLLVPFHASAAAARLAIEASREPGAEVRSASGRTAPNPEAMPLLVGGRRRAPLAEEFDRRLRAREFRDLAPLVRERGPSVAPRLARISAPPPSPGETFQVNVNAEQTCTDRIDRTVQVRAVGEHIIIATDTQNPTNDLDSAAYRSIAELFDRIIYPAVTRNFGEPTDIDGNGRVIIVFTRAVNELTPPGSTSYIAGFFYGRDLFPREDTRALQGCEASNFGEILYLLAPDPLGEVHGNRRSTAFVMERALGVLAHELQHLISASRRLRVHQHEQWAEEFWLNEGLSHIAEELAFYEASSLAARSNIGYEVLRGATTSIHFTRFQLANFERLGTYLADPGGASLFSDSGVTSRGAAWSFLRYAADRHEGTEQQIWQRMIDSERTGYDKLLSVFAASPLAWIHDWAVSLYVDDSLPLPARFQQPSWHNRSVLQAYLPHAGVYPLQPHRLTIAPFHGEVVAGGAGFLRLEIPEGANEAVRFASGGESPFESMRLTVLRIR